MHPSVLGNHVQRYPDEQENDLQNDMRSADIYAFVQ
jgi:hypothetical protein